MSLNIILNNLLLYCCSLRLTMFILQGVVPIKETILVVEDDAIGAMDLNGILTSLGYSVLGPVSSGAKALDKIKDTTPDLVLMDITIKGDINGIETAKLIKDQIEVPVIFLTAHSDEKTVKQAEQVNPAGYIIKPFDGVKLRKTIESTLS